jgi:hypothetical protein
MTYQIGVSDAMLDMTGTVRKLGVAAVAAKAGVRENVVKKFCANPLQSKNSDIAKIKKAVAALEQERGNAAAE